MIDGSVTEPRSTTMQYQVKATPTPQRRLPWNKGKLTGAKPPLRPKHVWSIRTKLQIEGRARDLAMFNLAIDSIACQRLHVSYWHKPAVGGRAEHVRSARVFQTTRTRRVFCWRLSNSHRLLGGSVRLIQI